MGELNGVSRLLLSILLLMSLGVGAYVRWRMTRHCNRRLIDSLRAFSTAMELRFPSHRGVTDAVLDLCQKIAVEMMMPRKQQRDLEMVVHLRDIGLCTVPYGIFNARAEDRWTLSERERYNQHAEDGGAMLEQIPSLRRFATAVRCHHCSYDRLGFPQLRDVSEIPMVSHVLNVVTAYVWLEKTQGDLLACETIRQQRGKALHPVVVDALLAVLTSPGVSQQQLPYAPV